MDRLMVLANGLPVCGGAGLSRCHAAEHLSRSMACLHHIFAVWLLRAFPLREFAAHRETYRQTCPLRDSKTFLINETCAYFVLRRKWLLC